MGANVLKMNEICNVTNNSNHCCIYLPVKKATANVKTWINGTRRLFLAQGILLNFACRYKIVKVAACHTNEECPEGKLR